MHTRPHSWGAPLPLALLLPLLLCAGCTLSVTPLVLAPRDVGRAGGAPEIVEIVDIGTRKIPTVGERVSAAGGQRRAVIGELLLLRGHDFGKQPRISVGGRGSEVLAHVEDGVVVRVPWGIDPGEVEVEVVHARGRAVKRFRVVRLGLALLPDRVRVFEVAADGGVTLRDELALPGVRDAVFSHDGSAAYLVGGGEKAWLKVLDLTGAAPKVVNDFDFPGKTVRAVDAAVQVPLAALLTDTHLVVFRSENALIPSFFAPSTLSPQLLDKGVLSLAIGGMGRSLALLLADLNEVALFDTADPAKLGYLSLVKVLPDEPLQLVQDLRFSHDGGSLWMASGDNARSIGGGTRPSRISMLQVIPGSNEKSLKLHRSWELGTDLSVHRLAVARGEPIPPGTAIRPEPSSSSVYLSANASAFLQGGAERFRQSKGQGRVIRSSLGEEPAELLAGAHLLTAQDIAGKTQVLVALGCALDKRNPRLILASQPAWERGELRITELGSLDPAALEARPLDLGRVRLQP